jgi:hypothetical protein
MSLQQRLEYWSYVQVEPFSGSWEIDDDEIIYWTGNLSQPSYELLNSYSIPQIIEANIQRHIIDGNLLSGYYPFTVTGPWSGTKDYNLSFQLIEGRVFLDVAEFITNGESGLSDPIESVEELLLLRPLVSDWYNIMIVINDGVPTLGSIRFSSETGKISVYAGINNEPFTGLGNMGWRKTTMSFKA